MSLDFVLVSPVLIDKFNPKLGWKNFSKLAVQCSSKVFALGGMNILDLEIARKNLSPELLEAKAEAMPMNGSMNFKWQMQQRSNQLYYAGQSRMNNLSNLLNPIAWAKFIEAWKRGDFKREENR